MPDGPLRQAPTGVPFLNAVAELVIDLGIAVKNELIYGRDHPVARKSGGDLAVKLQQALSAQPQLTLHFAGETIICEKHYLERRNPIYRQCAKLMSGLGIASLTFTAEAGEEVLGALVAAINSVRRDQATPEEARRVFRELSGRGLEIGLLRDLLTFTERESVRTGAESEAERLWGLFLAELAEKRPGGGGTPAPESAEEGGEPGEEPRGEEQQYATAVIEYLKSLDRSQREKLVLKGSDVGRRLSELVGELRPELREQLVCAALGDDRLSAPAIGGMLDIVGAPEVVGALERLNREGRTIPLGAFQAVSLFTRSENHPGLPAVAGSAAKGGGADLQSALEALLAPDQRHTYMSPEYEAKMESLLAQAHPLTGDRERTNLSPRLQGSHREAEDRFLTVADDLLQMVADDPEVPTAVVARAGDAFLQFLDERVREKCLAALHLGERARQRGGEGRFAWERPEVLSRLTEQVCGNDPEAALDASQILSRIGRRAVPPLVEALAISPELSVRRRVMDSLTQIEQEAGAELVRRLDAAEPWYLQRNLIGVLRQRRDPAGTARVKELWGEAHPKVRVEILHYLYATGDPDCLVLLERFLSSEPQERAVRAARLALQWRWKRQETIEVLLRWIKRVPFLQRGTPHHLLLLRLLVETGYPAAREYAVSVPRRVTFPPWRRMGALREIADIVGQRRR